MPKGIPDGYTSVTPYLLVKDVKSLIDFCVKAFGAAVNVKMDMPDGSIAHADITVFGSHIMMGYGGDKYGEKPAMLYLYVEDADAVHAKALAAGAKLESPVANQFYGDRAGSVEDPTGNTWWIATRVAEVPDAELKKRMMAERRKDA